LSAYIALQFVFLSGSLFLAGKIPALALHYIELYSDYVFTLFEFSVFIFFFKQTLSYAFQRRVIKPLLYLYFSISVLLLITDIFEYGNLAVKTEFLLWELQAICLLIPCVFYFIEIFRNARFYLSEKPSFWIVTGLSLFMASTLPFSIFSNYILSQSFHLTDNFCAIFNIFYCILFIMIAKAHVCKVEGSTERFRPGVGNVTA
jgi:hypothetical protein